MPTIRITIAIDADSLARLDALCAASGYSRSEQIEGMIDADYETLPKAKQDPATQQKSPLRNKSGGRILDP
jgi:hypothetical protein